MESRTERWRTPAMLKPIVSRSCVSLDLVWCSSDSMSAPWPCIRAAESWSWYIRSAKNKQRATSSTWRPSFIQRSKYLNKMSICVSGRTSSASSRPTDGMPRSVRSRYLQQRKMQRSAIAAFAICLGLLKGTQVLFA